MQTTFRQGVIRSAGTVTEVRVSRPFISNRLQHQLTGGSKHSLGAWSAQSRRNCLRLLNACDWSSIAGWPVMVTLSYAEVQFDGRLCRKHLDTFRHAWERKWGPARGAWKEEFQARGAIHWHLVLWVPLSLPSLGSGQVVALDSRACAYDAVAAKVWLLATWQRIVGDNTKEVDWTFWDGPISKAIAYFAGYSAKKDKEYQNVAPVGSVGWGRRWGIWGIRPMWSEQQVSSRQAYRVRRVLRGIQRARRKKRVRGGSWVIHESAGARRAFLGAIRRL